MEEDENALRECFEDFLPSNRLDLGLQRLADVRDLAAADDTESFVLAYGLVVQSMPSWESNPQALCSPRVKIFHARLSAKFSRNVVSFLATKWR